MDNASARGPRIGIDVIDLGRFGARSSVDAASVIRRASSWCGFASHFVAGDDHSLDAAAAWAVAEAAVKADRGLVSATPRRCVSIAGRPTQELAGLLGDVEFGAAMTRLPELVLALVLTEGPGGRS